MRIFRAAAYTAAFIATFAVVRPATAGTVYVKPIQVCDDLHGDCGNSGQELFSAATNKIWAQAGIVISFLSWTFIDDASLQFIDSAADLNNLFSDSSADPSANVISMWFVKTINNCAGVAAFGCANTPGNRIAIDDDTFSFNSGVGRIDTIAHEIGHSLGLGHCNDGGGSCAGDFLMNGGARTIPGAVGDINPDGLKLDKLSNDEITTAQASALNTPEPGTISMMVIAIAGLALARKRR